MYSLATDYQTLLEHHRRNPDDEELWKLFSRTYREIVFELHVKDIWHEGKADGHTR
jgi:hypothetical protein